MKPATARREGAHVIVPDPKEAQRVRAKGHVGEPLPGGGLRMSLVEAAYAVHEGRVAMADGATWVDLVAGAEAAYFTYADLRDRGLVVRHTPDGMAAWQRAQAPPAKPWFPLHAASERDPLDPEQAVAWAAQAAVVGVLDDDGVVTHYRFTQETPEGRIPMPTEHAGAGHLLQDRVVVPGAAAWSQARIGTAHGDDLLLSPVEAEALRRRGLLDIAPVAGDARLPVYAALRDAGVVAKSGFRFGTHLRGYDGDPGTTHARWLIQCAEPGRALHWSEVSRAVRLAHGVRKRFLLAVAEPVRFVGIEWFRP